ncbi:hypothetical protein B0F87_104107 [Methylobacter tundripaludum]|uniref:Low-complexity protein n=1 Tax=Methylobacter tundripaludum TaxID=173365 RepID=A0A2S6HEW9_9GAMM|nr:hypothetical protein [Methylobacter tundripaludum]PPK76017.1 hypothetical protein B0F87_104107 [Methylobacter tundripaludum]
MNKKTITLTLGCAIASSLLSMSPAIQAGENPFAMSAVSTSQQLAAADEKLKEGEAKCGADKTKDKAGERSAGKIKEGKCGEGKCGADKTKGNTGAEKK